MTMTEFSAAMTELAKKHPDALVVYSKDNEGNGYEPVHYTGTAGFYREGDFYTDDESYQEVTGNDGKLQVNAVCVN